MPRIYVDADACPVKQEIYRVAERHGVPVVLVANSWMATPDAPWLELEVVGGGFDEADDWIVDHIGPNDLVVTADLPLAGRCLEKGAKALGHKGREFTPDNIGDLLATREILSDLRDTGTITGGPPPFEKKDRSAFLQKLENLLRVLVREAGG